MAISSLKPSSLFLAAILLIICIAFNSCARGQADHASLQLMTEALEWPTTESLYEEGFDMEGEEGEGMMNRRSLYWTRHYYISYGALSANRIPCPPRSGRSYYTHNCYRASGPVHPYTRGCSAITRCRR